MGDAPPTDDRPPLALVLRFWSWAALLRPLKHMLPFRTLVGVVHRRHRAAPRDHRAIAAIVRYLESRQRFPWRAPANCLERSLAAFRLLSAAGENPELLVGVRRAGSTESLDGHVWVNLDQRPVAEATDFIAQFTPVLRVRADGSIDRFGPSAQPVRANSSRSGA